MIFRRIVILLLVVMFVAPPEAEARRRRWRARRAHTLSPEIDLVVTFGDRVSIFQMVKDKRQFYLHFFNSLGQKKDLAISKGNYQYLVNQAQAVKGSGANIEECPRSNISLEGKSGGKVRACLHGDSQTTKKLIELANEYSAIL